MTARCRRCGQTWEVDPPLQVECPTCGAEPETKCRRPSGHPVPNGFHAVRDRRALAEVDGYERCPVGGPSKRRGSEHFDAGTHEANDQRELFG